MPSYQEMDRKLSAFHNNFKNAIGARKEELAQSRAQHASQISALEAKHKSIEANFSQLEQKEAQLRSKIEKENATLNEAKKDIYELQATESEVSQTRNALQEKIDILNREINLEKKALHASQKSLSKNLSKDSHTVELYESYLGLKIDSVNAEVIKFGFFNLVQKSPQTVFEIVLDLSDREGNYKVQRVSPELAKDDVQKCVAQLNESRSLVQFLKSMRSLFEREI